MSERNFSRLNQYLRGIQIRLQTKFSDVIFRCYFRARSWSSRGCRNSLYWFRACLWWDFNDGLWILTGCWDTIAEIGYTQYRIWILCWDCRSTPIFGGTISCYCPRQRSLGNADQDPLSETKVSCLGLRWMRQKNLCHFQSHSATSWSVVWQSFVSLWKSAIFVQMSQVTVEYDETPPCARGYSGYFNSTRSDVSNEQIHEDVS